MILLMFIIAFVIGYPIFMILAYILAKTIFTKIDAVEEELQQEKLMQMVKARRVKVRRQQQRLIHA